MLVHKASYFPVFFLISDRRRRVACENLGGGNFVNISFLSWVTQTMECVEVFRWRGEEGWALAAPGREAARVWVLCRACRKRLRYDDKVKVVCWVVRSVLRPRR